MNDTPKKTAEGGGIILTPPLPVRIKVITMIFKSFKKNFIVQSQGKFFLKVDIKWDVKIKKSKLSIGGFSFFGHFKFRYDF